MKELESNSVAMMRGWARFGWCVACGIATGVCSPQTLGKPAKADTRISLASAGYYPAQPRMLLDNTVNQTIDFVDDSHLLITFAVKELLPRVVDDPETDVDRLVKAILMEIPSGQILAETKWRTHDANRYLWKLGRGEFLLRLRGQLSTFNPLAGLKTGKSFEDQGLMIAEGAFRSIGVTPEGDLLQIEMVDAPPAIKSDALKPLKQRVKTSTAFIQQIERNGQPKYAVKGEADFAGASAYPMLASGLLDMQREDAQHWGFEWKQFTGNRVVDLAGIESSCRPLAGFISSFEFIALGCRGGGDLAEVGAFNLEGKAMWLLALAGQSNSPTTKTAPKAGRFVFSRLLTMMGSGPSSNTPDTVQGQEINVFQNSTGRQLTRVVAVPAQQAGANFDVSPDGLRLAVAQGNAVEIYNLPRPTPQEKKDVDHALQSAPKAGEGQIRLLADQGR